MPAVPRQFIDERSSTDHGRTTFNTLPPGPRLRANRIVEIRTEKAGIVQAGVGKASFSEEKLIENIRAFADAVQKSRPAGAKGHFINRVAISSTMGPGVKVEPATLFPS